MSDNPYESPEDKFASGPKKPAVPLLVRLLIYGAIIALVVALLLPAHRGVREAPLRNLCLNKMKQLALGILNHEATHGELPPAYTVDEQGNRLHSWRALILPFLDRSDLYDQIDFAEPWDNPKTNPLCETTLNFFTCPSTPFEYGETTYFAVVGPEAVFLETEGRKLDEITDGPENTIMLIEAPSEMAVHWMSPTDVTIEQVLEFDRERPTGHPGGFHAVFVDGHVEFIDADIDREALRAMLTIAGGEDLGEQ